MPRYRFFSSPPPLPPNFSSRHAYSRVYLRFGRVPFLFSSPPAGTIICFPSMRGISLPSFHFPPDRLKEAPACETYFIHRKSLSHPPYNPALSFPSLPLPSLSFSLVPPNLLQPPSPFTFSLLLFSFRSPALYTFLFFSFFGFLLRSPLFTSTLPSHSLLPLGYSCVLPSSTWLLTVQPFKSYLIKRFKF